MLSYVAFLLSVGARGADALIDQVDEIVGEDRNLVNIVPESLDRRALEHLVATEKLIFNRAYQNCEARMRERLGVDELTLLNTAPWQVRGCLSYALQDDWLARLAFRRPLWPG